MAMKNVAKTAARTKGRKPSRRKPRASKLSRDERPLARTLSDLDAKDVKTSLDQIDESLRELLESADHDQLVCVQEIASAATCIRSTVLPNAEREVRS